MPSLNRLFFDCISKAIDGLFWVIFRQSNIHASFSPDHSSFILSPAPTTNIFTADAIRASDGLRLDSTRDVPWLCALLLRWPPGARLVEYPLPRVADQPLLYAFAFLGPDGRHFLPMRPDTPFTDIIPAQGARCLRRSTVARYLTRNFVLRQVIFDNKYTVDGSFTMIPGAGVHRNAKTELLRNEGRITAAGKRLRATLDPPHDRPLESSEHIVPLLVLPDSDPATWNDHTRFCPIHGRVHPITIVFSSSDWIWSQRCGREFTYLACPRCLYSLHSVLSAMN